jgi:hypothetical protein
MEIMPSKTDSGNAVNVANLGKMNTTCTGFGPLYNPSNPNITIKALTAKYIASDAAVKAVEPFKKPYKDALDARQVQFVLLTPLARAAYGVLASSDGVSATTLSDAYMLVKKIAGTNKPSTAKKKTKLTEKPGEDAKPEAEVKPAEDTKTKEEEAEPVAATHSTSQLSFDMRLANYYDLVALLNAEPNYTPNEADITVIALNTFADELKTVNDAVVSVYGDYSKSLNARDTLLYAPETGLTDIAAKVKSYVSGISSLSATDKKLVSGLRFRTPDRKKLHF